MQINEIIHFLAGPVIGGLIGYFTNFIAIRMLFWPRHEVKIGKYTLPFTPGIIPKRKDKLARAIGETVAEKVFTETDIEQIFLSDGMMDAVADSFMRILFPDEEGISLLELMEGVMDETEIEDFQKNLDEMMSRRVHQAINRTDIAEQVSVECSKILRERVQGTIASKFMNASRISSVSDYMGKHLQQYVKEQANTLIMPMVRGEIARLMVQPTGKLLEDMKTEWEDIHQLLRRIYRKFISEYSMELVKMFDIASLTEKKIIEFQVEEIEQLVDQTIHREMQAVINLGAVLGVVIGLVNAFI